MALGAQNRCHGQRRQRQRRVAGVHFLLAALALTSCGLARGLREDSGTETSLAAEAEQERRTVREWKSPRRLPDPSLDLEELANDAQYQRYYQTDGHPVEAAANSGGQPAGADEAEGQQQQQQQAPSVVADAPADPASAEPQPPPPQQQQQQQQQVVQEQQSQQQAKAPEAPGAGGVAAATGTVATQSQPGQQQAVPLQQGAPAEPHVPVTQQQPLQRQAAPQGRSAPANPSLTMPGVATKAGTNQKPCWIFHHMNKSGGTTVKFLLKKWIHDKGYSVAQFDTEEWLQGGDFAKDFIQQQFDFYWGSYTEGLRRHGGEQCTWFTIFRHPVSRLVSAYFYCQKPERFPDPLCANHVQRVDSMDLVTFAKHWTNFGLRQYVTSFVLPEEITTSPVVSNLGPEVPGWYKMRLYFDSLAAPDADDMLVDAAMFRFLQPVQNLLNAKYKAVGILEEFNTTLHLFNRALQLPDYDWLEQYARVGAVNVNNKDEAVVYTEEDRVMDIAMTDVTIKRYLKLDLLLYEHAVAIHRHQAASYDLLG